MNEPTEKTEKIRGKNGGARPGSGRKPLIDREQIDSLKEQIALHGVSSPEGLKKARVLILLERLFNDGTEGNIQSAKEYLDRVLGKSKDTVELAAKIETNNLTPVENLNALADEIAKRLKDKKLS